MQDRRDDRIDRAIDDTLAALRHAALPAGLESRIERQLQQHQRAAALGPGWRGILRGSTVAGGWLRGAFSGACLASAIAVALLWLPRTRVVPQPTGTTVNTNSGYAQTFPKLVVEQHSHPCTPTVLQAQVTPAPHPTEIARGALPENHRQPLELPLTRQERDLVRLVQLAGPQQLVEMTQEAKAQEQAEDDASFQKFFTPPPKPAAEAGGISEAPAGDSSAATPSPTAADSNQAAPEAQPQSTPSPER